MNAYSRRGFMRIAATAAPVAAWPGDSACAGDRSAVTAEAASVISRYLESLAKPDGGYGWPEQPDSCLAETYAAVGTYHILGVPVPRAPASVAAFVRQGHPVTGAFSETRRHAAELREFTFQQIQSLLWLGMSGDPFRPLVAGWKRVSPYMTAYEAGGNPILAQEVFILLCRRLLALPCDALAGPFGDYLGARRRKNGSFNTTPASDGSDGHLVNTWFGMRGMAALGLAIDPALGEWLRCCQQADGGFTWCPEPALGGVSDMAYTWAGVRALALLGLEPGAADACRAWVRSLWNADGGFADREGAASSATATYQACDVLSVLGGGLGGAAHRRRAFKPVAVPEELHAFTIQFEAPGEGSVVEAVELAQRLRIHLWGAKNSPSGWLGAARECAATRGVPVTFFPSNEEYGTRVGVPGLGSFTHVNDPVAAPGQPLSSWPRREGLWPDFRAEKIEPLIASGGMMLWQICDHEAFARVVLDESLRRGGYGAVSAFHFGCHNMIWALPFMMRYRHDLPFVALQDAHGEAWWWSGMLAGFRTLFLAKEPTWAGWQEALRAKRVVAVRRDARTSGRLRMLGGSDEVRQAFLDRIGEWRWWSESGTVLDEMPVSVVALRPEDRFEVGRPETGVHVRIRLRREWVEGKKLSKSSMVSCVQVSVDGKPVGTERVERFDTGGLLEDCYELVRLPASSEKRVLLATFRQQVPGGGVREVARRADV